MLFPPSREQATHQRHIQQILCEIEQLCSTQHCSRCNSQYIQYGLCMYVNVNMINWMPMMQRREIILIRLKPWEHSPSSIPSSLPSPPFLLTCAVRGDINLSDRLCDPPSGLGGRRRAVNINILPGFATDMERPWPPWIFIHDHRQKKKHEPISMAENLAVTCKHHNSPHPLCKQHDQYCQFSACSWLFAHFYFNTGR